MIIGRRNKKMKKQTKLPGMTLTLTGVQKEQTESHTLKQATPPSVLKGFCHHIPPTTMQYECEQYLKAFITFCCISPVYNTMKML
jgi:hypothetical protein